MLSLLVLALLLQPECEPCPVSTPPVLAKIVEGGLEFDPLHTHVFAGPVFDLRSPGDDLAEEERGARSRPVSEFTLLPEIKRFVVPRLPEAGRDPQVGSRVVVEILLDPTGKVRSSTIYESDGCRLEVPALEAVARMTFAPGEIDGTAVWSIVRIPFTFSFD